MAALFKHKTKKTEAVPEPTTASPEPVQAATATPVEVPPTPVQAATATPVEVPPTPVQAATVSPVEVPPTPAVADATFWSGASMDDELIRVEEKWQDGALVVRAELPGIDPDRDVRLTVVNGRLVIEAERHQEDKIERDGYVLEEQRYGLFARALPLGDGVDVSAITGTYKDGVLEVRIPMPLDLPTKPATRIPITT
jgi:HSP20 family protein